MCYSWLTTFGQNGQTVAADEIVIGTFLNMRGIRPSANELMAQSQDATRFHAEAHATVAELRAAAGQSSDNAMFGRKIQVRLQGNDVVTWVLFFQVKKTRMGEKYTRYMYNEK